MAQRTINSPGVEIRESDLSLTAPANVGTNVYVTGFAQQGPIDEVLTITTKQELVQVFGTPTNSAERYFHYSINELLNSPATIYASRLPYGAGSGDGFGSKYGALVYPVVTVTGDTETNQVSTFQLAITDFVTEGSTYADLSGAALSGAYLVFQDSNMHDGSTGDESLSSFTVGFSGSRLNAPGGTGFGGNVYGMTRSLSTLSFDAIINVDNTSSIATLRTEIARGISLSSQALVGFANNNALSGTVANALGTNSQKFTLSGDVPRVSGVPKVGPSVAEPFTETNATFTLSAASDQGVSYDLNVLSGTYVLGEPTHFEISESDYLKAVAGTAFTWSDTASTSGFGENGLSGAYGAGVVLLNKSTTTINPNFEGYYVGLADNTNLNPATDFDNILFTKTVTQSGNSLSGNGVESYTTLGNSVLEFKLSASSNDGTTNSISEVIDNFTDYDISNRTDDDLLNLGVKYLIT